MKRNTKIAVKKVLKMKRCRYCLVTENLTIDHKVPLSNGGTDKITNLQVLCARCNGIKSSMSAKQVRSLFKWFVSINDKRVLAGKKPYGTSVTRVTE